MNDAQYFNAANIKRIHLRGIVTFAEVATKSEFIRLVSKLEDVELHKHEKNLTVFMFSPNTPLAKGSLLTDSPGRNRVS